MKLTNKFVALDLRYLEKENTGLSRYAINISKYLIKENKKTNLNLLLFFLQKILCSLKSLYKRY